MPPMPSLIEQLAIHVKHGDHLCVVCEDPQERLHAAAQYVTDGLRRNEFVMYAADAATTATLRELVAANGIDVGHEIGRGALHLPNAEEAYLIDGRFDPDAMYAAFELAIETALAAGFAGCRFAGEPLWALERADLRAGLIEFEGRLNTLFRDRKAAGFCVYDKQTWPAEVVRDILRTHPVAVVDDMVCRDNVFFEPDAVLAEPGAGVQVDRMLAHLRALRTSETRLQVAVDAGRLGTWEFDLQDGSSERSRRHDEIFGYAHPVADWGRAQLLDHVVPDDRDRVAAAFDGALDNGAPWHVECRIRRSDDGALRWIELHGRADPPGGAGRARRMLGIIADITERKELEQALRDTDRRKDEFLATLAHELRNPLAPIFNVLHLLQQQYAADPALQRMHGVMDRQARHLGRLVEDLLDVSRISTGRIVLQRQTVDLGAVLASAIEAAQPLIDAAQHTFRLAAPAAPILLEVDATRLAQVFLNLLSNAVKYTPAKGQIELTVGRDDGHAIVRIRDSGVGLERDMIPRMFDMFVQGHRVGDHAQGGLGIGLALARQLVALHGGSIEARSEGLGHGTEMTVRLPAPGADAANDAAEETPPPALAGRRRVLVVDDNVDAADTLAASLEFTGHAVRAQYGGQAALALVAGWRPDVAVLDIGMPGMDGYELARRLRALLPEVRLIALTGWGQGSDLRRAAEAGFDLHRTKPVNLAVLMADIVA